MWDKLQQLIATNQFFAGGAVLALFGFAAAYGRRLFWGGVERLKLFLFCQCNFESAYDFDSISWLTYWLANQEKFRTAKRVFLRAWGPEQTPQFTPAPGMHFFRWHGKLVILERRYAPPQQGQSIAQEGYTIWLRGSRQDLEEFIRECRDSLRNAVFDDVKFMVSCSSYWSETRKFKRPLETVILPTGVKEKLLADIDDFWASREHFAKYGRPWRYGLLLSGPPGTGKSSLAIAIASRYNKPVYMLNLSACASGAAVLTLLLNIPHNAILLIEDMDRDLQSVADMKNDVPDDFSQPRAVGEAGVAPGQKITPAILLNALDGPLSSEGRLLIITTNHPERIDPALLRPGRIDQRVEFITDLSQYEQMYHLFFPEDAPGRARAFATAAAAYRPTMATLQEFLLRRRAAVWDFLPELGQEQSRSLAVTTDTDDTEEALCG